jgi:hypothetical protein
VKINGQHPPQGKVAAPNGTKIAASGLVASTTSGQEQTLVATRSWRPEPTLWPSDETAPRAEDPVTARTWRKRLAAGGIRVVPSAAAFIVGEAFFGSWRAPIEHRRRQSSRAPESPNHPDSETPRRSSSGFRALAGRPPKAARAGATSRAGRPGRAFVAPPCRHRPYDLSSISPRTVGRRNMRRRSWDVSALKTRAGH